MKAIISTTIKTSPEKIWNEIQKISSLLHVAAPLLKFRSTDNGNLPDQWSIGKEYPLALYFLGIIPLGKHVIRISKIDSHNMTILSNEFGHLTNTWNHLIKIERIEEEKIKYTDEIDIEAGPLTIGIWLFSQFFYRHRQRRWKALLKN